MNPAIQETYDYLKKCEYYFIATMDGDQPRVRGFGTYSIFEDKLYIQTGKFKDVSKQLAINPKTELIAYDGNGWLRLSGTLVNDDSLEAKKKMIEDCPRLNARYKYDDDNMQVFYFKDATASFCTDDGRKVLHF